MIRPHPDVRRWQRRGTKHRGKRPRAPAPYGGHRQGEGRTGERKRYLHLMPRDVYPWRWDAALGDRACRREAATATGDEVPAVRTPWPRGIEGALAGRVSDRAERENPVEVRVRPGKPTAREAQLLCGGNGWSTSECR